MEILGYVGYTILCFLAITWTIGVRMKLDAGVPTIFGALFFLTSAVVLAILGLNKLHSLWIIVAGFAFSALSAPIALSIPIISAPFRILVGLFAGIVRVGIPSHKIKAAQDAGMRTTMGELAKRQSKNE
ncbi:MAG: hypothetical protein C4526_01260 [Nitrospiraceae bacterium]|nr:MAG: hypothetical protein C4526_01260 [Nitrospiraceae bacterium]